MLSLSERFGFAAISENSGEADKWIEDKNARFAYFNSVIKAADPVKLLSAIKCIYRRKGEIEGSGKKLFSADENVLLTAEKLVKGEFAYILGIEEDAVADYIQSKA